MQRYPRTILTAGTTALSKNSSYCGILFNALLCLSPGVVQVTCRALLVSWQKEIITSKSTVMTARQLLRLHVIIKAWTKTEAPWGANMDATAMRRRVIRLYSREKVIQVLMFLAYL